MSQLGGSGQGRSRVPTGNVSSLAGQVVGGTAHGGQNTPAGAAGAAGSLMDRLRGLAEAIQSATAALASFGQSVAQTTQALAAAVGAVATPLDALGSGLQQSLAPLSSMMRAVGMAVGPMQALSGSVGGLLGALNPGLVQALQYSMRELSAAFGILIEPIARELVPLFRELAATLAPAFRALAPVIGTIAQAFGKVAAVVATVFATVLTAVAPILQVLADLLSDVVTALAPILTLFASLAKAIAPLFEALAKGLTPIIQVLTKALVVLVAGVLQMFGATKALDDMVKALEPQRGEQSGGLQALTGARFTGFSEYGRDLALKAATATGGMETEKKQSEYVKDIAETVKNFRDGKTTLLGEITKAVKDGVLAAFEGLKGAVYAGATRDITSPASIEEMRQRILADPRNRR